MLKEFREFVLRGPMLDIAVGIVIGVAFGRIITSLVNDILMPPIGLFFGQVDFTNLFINLTGTPYPSLTAAKEAGAATINYGLFVNTVIDFVILAFVLFLLITQVTRLRPKEAPATKECPYCYSSINIKATRCPYCTSQLSTT